VLFQPREARNYRNKTSWSKFILNYGFHGEQVLYDAQFHRKYYGLKVVN